MSFPRRKIIRALEARGYRVLRDTGRHTVYTDDTGTKIPVPRHAQIARGTTRAIAREAGIEWQTFQQEVR